MADNRLGPRRLALDLPADNEPALARYKRFGFKPGDIRRDAVFRTHTWTDILAMARLRR